MNENMAPGHECYRLIKHWEKGPLEVNGVPWPRSAEGAALKAYQCSAGKWTISFGVRWHPDGRPVVEGDTIPDSEVMPYLEAAMGRVASDVRRAFDIQLTQNQFDAITVWVYNLGIGRMNSSTELKDFINQGRTSDAAAEMCTYVYATTQASDGYPWKRAMRGLLIRRLTESCVWMGYDWEEACEPDGIALPTKRRFEPEWVDPKTGKKGRYYDDIQVGKTKLSDTLYKAQNYPLALVLNQPAPPTTMRVPDGKAEQPGAITPSPSSSAASAPKVSPAPTPPSQAKPSEAKPTATPAAPRTAPVPAPLPTDVGSKPPVVMPPSVQVNTQSDMGPTTRTMWVSKRFWGGVLIIAGRLIIVADVGGHFSPAVKSFIGDGVLMDWMTGVIVTMVGELILDQGEKKAKGPMDTPKRIALTTPAP